MVDDDHALLRTLASSLHRNGYQVETASSGRHALEIAARQRPSLVLLDLDLDGADDLDGLSVLVELRTGLDLAGPVVVLSARTASEDKVEALDLGADDYVTKPFGMDELLARIRATLRHELAQEGGSAQTLDTGDLRIDLTNRIALRAGHPVHLTPTEWRLLEVLTRHPGRLIRQRDLLHEVWGPSYRHQSNYLRVYLANLRRKLEDEPARPRHFLTEVGVGYRFVP
ncbi:response regulator [uncultured Friedmanniella sp.]|uniref:response regulator n=1 Tax=uncultured Friedmanniella sp. TaxID=335381 RepID=UPI0035CC00E0